MTDTPKNGLLQWQGRIERLKYFLIILATTVISIPLSRILEKDVNQIDSAYWVAFILIWPLAYVGIVAAIKRLHDLGRSGWYFLLLLIPLVNIAVGLYLLIAKGNSGANEYGPPTIPI